MLDVLLVSPSSLVAKEKAHSVAFPGHEGYLDIRQNHTDFLTQMSSGLVTLKGDGAEKKFFVSGGYAQVKENKIILLADVADSSENIDKKRAENSEKRARERLSKAADGTVQIQRALASLKRAQGRISLYQNRSSRP